VSRAHKSAWLGRRAWVLSERGLRVGGVVCSVDHRKRELATIMIRLDGWRGVVVCEEATRGLSWDFDDPVAG
jgi:hypothetical protein